MKKNILKDSNDTSEIPIPDFGNCRVMPFTFDSCFELNAVAESELKALEETLQSIYPQFYVGGEVDYSRLKEGIINSDGDAREIFKNLFRMPFRFMQGNYKAK